MCVQIETRTDITPCAFMIEALQGNFRESCAFMIEAQLSQL
jgi:hypothetical protein